MSPAKLKVTFRLPMNRWSYSTPTDQLLNRSFRPSAFKSSHGANKKAGATPAFFYFEVLGSGEDQYFKNQYLAMIGPPQR
jgi:hypothetical protein